MKRHRGSDELVEHWTLLPRETEVLTNKTGATRLGFAVLLKFFQLEAARVIVKSGGLLQLHWHQNADE